MKRYQSVGLLGKHKEVILRSVGINFWHGPQDEVNSESEWEVEAIIGKRFTNGNVLYEVQWKGYTETTWEPLANLDGTVVLSKHVRGAPLNLKTISV